MGRPKNDGWRLEADPRTGIFRLRFTHEGRERKLTTGTRDSGEAQEAAARIFSEVVSGRFRVGQAGIGARPGQLVDELAANWLDDEHTRLDETTLDQYGVYVRRWQDFFTSMERITPAAGEDYWRARLKQVKRKTVLKELSALRTFLGWCKMRDLIAEIPAISSPPKRAPGTPTTKPHKGKPLVLTDEQIEAVIAALPEMSSRRGRASKKLYPVRAVFELAWETALRPETLASLRAPDDYKKGVERLIIRDEADKARFGRELPLTARARAALDRVCPEVGVIFGAHDHRDALRAAAKAAGLPAEVAARISPYDFRHSRLTFLGARTTNLVGMQHLAGHKHASTTAIYMHANYTAAAEVLEAAGGAEFSSHFRPVQVEQESEGELSIECERRGSNPHGFTHRNLNARTAAKALVFPSAKASVRLSRVQEVRRSGVPYPVRSSTS